MDQQDTPLEKGYLLRIGIDHFKEINDNKTKAIRSKIVKKEYQEIYNLIKNGASNINAICKESEKSIKDINNILFMLEIDGFITKKQGEYKCI